MTRFVLWQESIYYLIYKLKYVYLIFITTQSNRFFTRTVQLDVLFYTTCLVNVHCWAINCLCGTEELYLRKMFVCLKNKHHSQFVLSKLKAVFLEL